MAVLIFGQTVRQVVTVNRKLGIGMRATNRGFTLIEVLVVLIIVAIITAVAVMAFGQFGRQRREQMIAEQFVRTIGVVSQQAILTPQIMGLGVSATGYRFYRYPLHLNMYFLLML
jgi:general secretion pathway protein H